MIVKIIRFCYSPFGVFGYLTAARDGDAFSCYTVERPWRYNRPFLSCIPVGFYSAIPIEGLKKKGALWQLTNVPGRSAIEFHVANTMDDLAGCIGLGDSLSMIGGKWAVINSTATMNLFNDFLDGEKQITVRIEDGKL